MPVGLRLRKALAPLPMSNKALTDGPPLRLPRLRVDRSIAGCSPGLHHFSIGTPISEPYSTHEPS
jgi:hypothetical protein